MLKGAVVSFVDPCSTIFWETCGILGTDFCSRSFGQRRGRGRNITAASTGFSSGVVKFPVNFHRSGSDSSYERRGSRFTFDRSKQSSVVAVKKNLTEFLGLKELSLKYYLHNVNKINTSFICDKCKKEIMAKTFVFLLWNLWKSSDILGGLLTSLVVFENLQPSSAILGGLGKSSEIIGNCPKNGRKLLGVLYKIEYWPFWSRFCLFLEKVHCYIEFFTVFVTVFNA